MSVIGTKQTSMPTLSVSAFEGNADLPPICSDVRF